GASAAAFSRIEIIFAQFRKMGGTGLWFSQLPVTHIGQKRRPEHSEHLYFLVTALTGWHNISVSGCWGTAPCPSTGSRTSRSTSAAVSYGVTANCVPSSLRSSTCPILLCVIAIA